ncbi:MAG: hypothetical protein Q8Q09_29290 [Deltaproteobacteria bacterium]|nr:hypothetical protein [Deltaproteobacteria bacterium]
MLSPSFGISLQDDFQRSMIFGLQGAYHFTDIIGLGAYVGYAAVQIPTALSSAAQSYAGLSRDGGMTTTNTFQPTYNVPNQASFTQQIGSLGLMIGAPQLTLTPLRGKLALFQNVFMDADVYLFASPAFIMVTERRDFDAFDVNSGSVLGLDSQAVRDSQTNRATRFAITGMFGAGLNFYINRFLSLSFEYRAYPFAWNTSGTDENTTASTCGANGMASCSGSPDYLVRPTSGAPATGEAGGRLIIDSNDRTFRWNQMINFSFNIFLPTAPRVGD